MLEIQAEKSFESVVSGDKTVNNFSLEAAPEASEGDFESLFTPAPLKEIPTLGDRWVFRCSSNSKGL